MRPSADTPAFVAPIFRCALSILRGTGQVMFQRSALCGAIMLLALFLAALGYGGCGHMSVFAGAVVALIVATVSGSFVRMEGIMGGLAGFNAILVGCAVFTFFSSSPWAWAFLLAGALLTLPVKYVLDRWLSPTLSSLTLPFVFVAWLVIAIAQSTGLCAPYTLEAIVEPVAITPSTLAIGWLKGISEVFLADSWVSGLLIVAAIATASPRAALWALIGSAAGEVMALVCGMPAEGIVGGIWGFSPALTAIAVATVIPPRRNQWLSMIAAIVLTFAIQYMTTPILAAIGLPVLTMPFCFATIAVAFLFPSRHKE